MSTHNQELELADYLTSTSRLIEEELESLVPEQATAYAQLFQAARYSLLNGGKRIRPILALATAEIFGASREKTLRAACTLELMHTYSLIHDDLPCMDNDDYRRGKPSLHKAFPEGQAVLAGDFLLTYAFEVLSTDPHLTSHQKIELIHLLSHSAGGHGMIAGQMMDLQSEGAQLTIEELQFVHRCKTGALISAAIQFGAIIGNANPDHIELLKAFARDIGLAFQIVDDVLDVTGSLKKAGAESSDIKNHKSTYVSLLGLDAAKAMANSLLLSAKQTLSIIPFETTRLNELADLIVNRRY